MERKSKVEQTQGCETHTMPPGMDPERCERIADAVRERSRQHHLELGLRDRSDVFYDESAHAVRATDFGILRHLMRIWVSHAVTHAHICRASEAYRLDPPQAVWREGWA